MAAPCMCCCMACWPVAWPGAGPVPTPCWAHRPHGTSCRWRWQSMWGWPRLPLGAGATWGRGPKQKQHMRSSSAQQQRSKNQGGLKADGALTAAVAAAASVAGQGCVRSLNGMTAVFCVTAAPDSSHSSKGQGAVRAGPGPWQQAPMPDGARHACHARTCTYGISTPAYVQRRRRRRQQGGLRGRVGRVVYSGAGQGSNSAGRRGA